jgi:hypothetical protein
MNYRNTHKYIFILLLFHGILFANDNDILADWWKKTSYAYSDALLSKYLFHADLLLQQDFTKGNTDNINTIIDSNFLLRYGHLSLGGHYTYIRDEVTQYLNKNDAGVQITANQYKLNTYLTYDINSLFFALVAYDFSRKEEIIFYDRDTLYVGAGVYLLNKKMHRLRFVLAPAVDNVNFKTGNNDTGYDYALMSIVDYTYTYNKKISFDLFSYYLLAQNSNYDEYSIDAKLNIKVLNHFYIVPNYTLKHYNFMSLSNQYEDDIDYGIKLKITF